MPTRLLVDPFLRVRYDLPIAFEKARAMRLKDRFSAAVVAATALCVSVAPVTIQANVISGDEYFAAIDRGDAMQRIESVLSREEFAAELLRLGVDPDAALARAEALSDHELNMLADDLEELPAGGGLLGTIGVVFVVLLILELVGVIDIFKKV
ncbi:MAG: PA2779 family protein [Gammaproteobacteria bacterium]|nr:PA2779 family protein [Gammaproteobacteria bacterium]